MKEMLKVYSESGELLLERDLGGETNPLLVLGGDKPTLAETVPEGAETLGALVRDADGWTLASANGDRPVTSGPKSGVDFHLATGVSYSLAGYVFRLESEAVEADEMLLWRRGRSAIAADRLVKGRNVFATRPGGNSIEVNPAVVGEELCEMFVTRDGLDVQTSGENALRLSVPRNTLFSVGDVHAMVMGADEAAKAVHTSNPFAWPSRGLRAALLFALLIAAAIALGAVYLNREADRLDRAAAADTGAERVEMPSMKQADVSAELMDNLAMVYEISFFRSLGAVLKPERQPMTADLIERGERFGDRTNIVRMVTFLKDVDAIQKTTHDGDWEGLGKVLGGVDAEMFNFCDADSFLDDAREVHAFVTRVIPETVVAILHKGTEEAPVDEASVSAKFDELKDNVFLSGEVVRRERSNAQLQLDVLRQYVPARIRYFRDAEDSGAQLLEAWFRFLEVFDEEDETFRAAVAAEREAIRKVIVERASNARAVVLIRLCDLGEAVGIDAKSLAGWREKAKGERKKLDVEYHDLYSRYRMITAVTPDSKEARDILDRMIALGLDDNRFHQWALREKERINTK